MLLSISFQKYITLTSLKQADNMLFYGSDTKQNNYMQRWGYDGENYNYFSLPLNDYEHVLSALLAKNRKEEHDYVEKCRLAEKNKESKPNIPVMVIDKLKSIWNTVFPLHSSIMNKLWITLEQERKDCLFIYITHDTTFAANHPLADKIWIKKYDGNNWEFEKIKKQ